MSATSESAYKTELRLLRQANRDVDRTSAARRDLPFSATRARRTTAVARWWTACEDRDRIEARLRDLGLTVEHCRHCGWRYVDSHTCPTTIRRSET